MNDPDSAGDDPSVNPETREYWKDLLEGRARSLRFGRGLFTHLPGSDRCQLCAAPFDGPAAPMVRLVGKGRWSKNPKFCASCMNQLSEHRGGAEVETALLFADVRGSTTLAEGMSPTAFRELMDEFFTIASDVVVDHDGIVDKFVGDEVVSLFVPALAGHTPVVNAAAAAKALMRRIEAREGTPFEVGVGVHTGIAFVGVVGSGSHADITAMGDPVNVAARLASAAGGGEILVSEAVTRAAQIDTGSLPRRDLELKGKSEKTTAYVL
jgi:adenylate cyclase